MSEVNMGQAKAVYTAICSALDGMDLNYNKFEEDLVVTVGHRGDDMNHDLMFMVDAKRDTVRLVEKLPFSMDPAKAKDIACAICRVNERLVLGGFCYNMEDRITFEVAQAYEGSIIGEETIKRMLMALVITVEEYDDKFMALNKGYLKEEDFKED